MNKIIWRVAYASVIGENSNNGGRTWNTNNGTKYWFSSSRFYETGIDDFGFLTHYLEDC
jgi:hypothetical protein